MSRQDYYVVSLLVISQPNLLCRDRTSLHLCGNLCCDLEVVSRPRFSLFSLFLCCDIKDPCRDIDLSPQLEVCFNVRFLCCDQANSTSKRHLLRLKFSFRD